MKTMLERPVEYGEVQLAPTSELVALAELATLYNHADRLDAVIRAAQALQREDEDRRRIALVRSGAASPGDLPRRR